MRIIAVGYRNSGVAYHRLFLPLSFMKKDFAFFTDVLNDEVLKDGYDILLINRFIQGVELDQILEYKNQYGLKLVVDIDDYWHLDPWHLLFDSYPHQKIVDHIRAADLVTCTNDALRNEIKPINTNVHIIPNALPFGLDQFTDLHVPSEDELVRYVYTGSVTHERDLRLIKNTQKRIASDKYVSEKSHFCLCGYEPESKYVQPVWHRMIGDFLSGFKLNGYIRTAMPVDQYMNLYNEADVSMVPLVDSKFNSMKSNIKVLEAAAKKIPVIASCVKPYSDCLYIHPIHSQGDWFKAVKKMSTDPIYRKELGQANHEWCVQHYSLDKINETRSQLFKSLI